MIRTIGISLLVLSLCACTSTKTKDAKFMEKVEVRAAEIVESESFDIDAEFEKASISYFMGDFNKALLIYENILNIADEDYENYHHVILGYGDSALALASVSGLHRVKAETAYKTLTQFEYLSDELSNKTLAGQVLLEIASGNSDDIEVRLNEALELNLHDPRLWNALGRFHDGAEDWVLATETYVKAMEAAGEVGYTIAPIVNNMGMSYLMRGKARDALKKFEQALALNADITIYDNNRRLALVLTGRTHMAVDGLTDKRAAQIYNDAGFVLAGRGQRRKARSYYKKAIELSPVYFEKAELNLLALANDTEQAGT
ncbi:MAG: hypothetical protein EX271_03800 [Acidimicrobiales bacterium]|nr:hypothetical protein [Hyphomonadaceae bacterium]RZV43469.1 MAG: hypothetical protein EX271_03800 [Acidimicrobiales bacterium]